MDRSRPAYPPHPPPGPPQPPFPPYSSAMPQPPPRQPNGDPFAGGRRDPFFASLNEKRESHLPHPPYRPLDPPPGQHRYDTLQPAPAPPASPFHTGPPLFRDDRRRSVTASYLGGPLEPSQHQHLPPPPRHMPPPASSPKESPLPQHAGHLTRGPLPTPPAYGHGRENGSGYVRPGSSMSLSHIMGSEPAGGPRQPLWSPAGPPRPMLGGGVPYNMPPSPENERRVPYGSRPRTPERRAEPHWGGGYPGHLHAGSPSASQNPYQPPEHGFGRLLQPTHQPPPPPQAIPPRPFSQPAGAEAIGRDLRQRPSFEHPNLPPVHPQHDGGSLEKAMRERAMSDLDGRRSVASLNRSILEQPLPGYGLVERPPYQPLQPPPADLPRFVEQRQLISNETERRVLSSPPRQANHPQAHMPGYPGELGPGPGPALMHGPSQFAEHYNGKPDHYVQAVPHPLSEPLPATNGFPSNGRPHPIESTPQNKPNELRRSTEEPGSNQRSFLGVNNDHARRLDRASPLPQAVQGAQSQPPDTGRDPGIKSEFGRMFSGLGSGVGSTPQPGHTPLKRPLTPVERPGPFEDELGRAARRAAADLESQKMPSANGRSGRSAKRPAEDELKVDGREERATPVTTTRTKRNKYTIPPGHHHHPLPPTHHHHHHHKAEDVLPTAGRLSATGFSNFKFPPNGQPSTTPIPHHHHHHPPPHHHHHSQKAVTRPHHPVTTIMTKQLVRSVANQPRHHLGSQLYSPSVNMPHSTAPPSLLGSTYVYENIPRPLPRFEGKGNCTFTIRVPRYYLTQTSRTAICAARRLWGTDVYTDDSDPVAAAIHSGWLKGAWPSSVDEDLLNLDQPLRPNETEDEAARLKAEEQAKQRHDTPPTKAPLDVWPGYDCHLTILVLPALERYASSVWNGVKSRLWRDNHDGMSFKIERLEWVDEGVAGRNEERGGAARRRRLAALHGVNVGAKAENGPEKTDGLMGLKMKSGGVNGLANGLGAVNGRSDKKKRLTNGGLMASKLIQAVSS